MPEQTISGVDMYFMQKIVLKQPPLIFSFFHDFPTPVFVYFFLCTLLDVMNEEMIYSQSQTQRRKEEWCTREGCLCKELLHCFSSLVFNYIILTDDFSNLLSENQVPKSFSKPCGNHDVNTLWNSSVKNSAPSVGGHTTCS